jgi:hypothetical protein
MTAPPQAHAHNLANAIRTDIGHSFVADAYEASDPVFTALWHRHYHRSAKQTVKRKIIPKP